MNNTTNDPERLSPAGLFCLAVTYRELHEDAAGMGLDDSFFAVSKIDPNAAVKCNCEWDEGHHENCDIVAANRILMRRQNAEVSDRRAHGNDNTTGANGGSLH